MVKLLDQETAKAIDAELMGESGGFSIDQLMELAGLAVAQAIHKVYEASSRILVIAGPGNNGGDGLVAARHLAHFGYQVEILYPKPGHTAPFCNLIKQCKGLQLLIHRDLSSVRLDRFDVLVDAIFGFGFQGQPRAPFDRIIEAMIESQGAVVSIDVPSGWSVEAGPAAGQATLRPDLLVSLTAPKLCAQHHVGKHYLGGRFIPPSMARKYQLDLPPFSGSSQIARLS